MLSIPIQAVPAQTVICLLGNQQCTINIYQKFFGLFLDLYLTQQIVSANPVLPTPIVVGAICWNLNFIVRYEYLGFSGDLAFWDAQGDEPPIFTGLGSRFQLVYLSTDEVAAAESVQAASVLAFAMGNP